MPPNNMNLNTQEIIAGIALYADSKKESEALERFIHLSNLSNVFLNEYTPLPYSTNLSYSALHRQLGNRSGDTL